MSDTVIVALLSLAGTFIGSFSGIKLITYRIQQLESKVEKHNQVIERVYKLEKHEAVVDEKIEHLEAYHT
jgi:hypothetical protein